MSQENNSSDSTVLLTFLAGAALGALVVALTTPKTGSELRDDLAGLGRRVKGKIGDLAQQGSQAWEAFNDDPSANGRDLRDQAAEAWEDVRKIAARTGSDLKQGLGEVAKDLRT